MRELEIVPQTKVRVWLNEMPDASYRVTNVVEHIWPTMSLRHYLGCRCAVEMIVHTGGHCPYGLLGAEFLPDDSSVLRSHVALSDSREHVFVDSLAGNLDEVYIGLPPEYVGGVLLGVASSSADEALGAGMLRFDCAAYGLIGSSQHIFQRLARIIVELLKFGPRFISDTEVIQMIEHSRL